MSHALIKTLMPIIVGIPLSVLTIRYFFKGSVLFRIMVYWISTLLMTDALANLSNFFPDLFPQYIVLPFGVIVILYFLFFSAGMHITVLIKHRVTLTGIHV